MNFRLAYLDWLRGLAVVIMILWHSTDAWTAPWARQSAAFDRIVFLGGWAAPLFLFLAGVSLSLAGASRVRRLTAATGEGAVVQRDALREASWRLQKRGWQVFGLAHLFRLQSFLLNPSATWNSLLKPDILNILGLGLVAGGFCWGRAGTRARQVVWLLGPAALVILLTPASREWWWPTLLRPYVPRLEAYIRPVSGMGVFSVFPWIGFVFAGAFLGSLLGTPRSEDADRSFHARLVLTGAAVGLAGAVGMHLPSPFAASSFWTTSLSFFLMRNAAMVVGVTLAWLWMRRPTANRWSPMVVFGRTSLFVYWVHVELAYGGFSYPLHNALSLPWSLFAFATLTVLMLGCAVLWMRRANTPLVPAHLRPHAA
jgi:uncharacterized membrane protein